ncbi:MAG: chorismate synthase [Myxococcaceae bacterium]|nr:chorismate synthase [Myxococcaceae bacterium]
MNTFGQLFRLTTFGESHGPAMGAVIDGCPSGVALTVEDIQTALDRRRPGQSALVTARQESDRVEILSGVYERKTLGTPIAAVVRNHDARAQDYAQLTVEDRPGHADAVWKARFGHRDPRGGGRTSGRETLSRVIGGAVAEALLLHDVPSVRTVAWVSQVGTLKAPLPKTAPTRAQVDAHATRCPDAPTAEAMAAAIVQAKNEGDSLGGIITVRVDGVPVGWGEPVFGKMKACMAHALGSIGAVTGVVWGSDDVLGDLQKRGRDFHAPGEFGPSEVYGGIQGGLSNGEPMSLSVFFKPPATLAHHAKQGRHDPCILPRAVPVVEAMALLVLADMWLLQNARPHQP